ncbi:hypothetical protein GCM10010282_33740 [Streptomyces roseolus]|nr:hypothetical protein GCM10010282_33740 [Streptomyces roseolus]
MGVGGGGERGREEEGGAEAGGAGGGPAGAESGEGLAEEEGEDRRPDRGEAAGADAGEPGESGLPAVSGDGAGGLGEFVGDPLAGGDRGVGDGDGDAVAGGEFLPAGEEGGDGPPVAGLAAVGAAGTGRRVGVGAVAPAVVSRLLDRHGAVTSRVRGFDLNLPLVARNCAAPRVLGRAARAPPKSDCRSIPLTYRRVKRWCYDRSSGSARLILRQRGW